MYCAYYAYTEVQSMSCSTSSFICNILCSTKYSRDKTFVVFTGVPYLQEFFCELSIVQYNLTQVIGHHNFFCEWHRDDVTTKVLSLECFVLYSISCIIILASIDICLSCSFSNYVKKVLQAVQSIFLLTLLLVSMMYCIHSIQSYN